MVVHLEMFLGTPLGLHPCYSTWLSVVAFKVAFLPMFLPFYPRFALHISARLSPLLSCHTSAYILSMALFAPGRVWIPVPGIQDFQSLGSTVSSFRNSFSATSQLPHFVLGKLTLHGYAASFHQAGLIELFFLT